MHASLEKRIESLSIPEREIDAGFSSSRSSLKFVEEVVSNIKWIYDAETALSKATRVSAEIVAAVYGPREPPDSLPENYRIMEKCHNKRVLKASVISGLSLITGGFLSFAVNNGFLLFLFLFTPILVFSALVWNDKKFYEIKREAEWYGIG